MVTEIRPTSNGAQEEILYVRPYKAIVEITGVAPILFHGWNNEAVEAKSKAAKNSKAKKTDNIESYVYRCENGNLGIKGEALHAAIVEAGRYRQDPRSPRKSARDLLKAAIIPLTIIADLGVKEWDYEDNSRVVVQRSAITRTRPAMKTGWKAQFELLINTPEYVSTSWLHELITDAGRLCGLYDHRPTYGRFSITHFETTDVI